MIITIIGRLLLKHVVFTIYLEVLKFIDRLYNFGIPRNGRVTHKERFFLHNFVCYIVFNIV